MTAATLGRIRALTLASYCGTQEEAADFVFRFLAAQVRDIDARFAVLLRHRGRSGAKAGHCRKEERGQARKK